MGNDYYQILGVSPDAEPEVINAAYRAMMRKYHPDHYVGSKDEAQKRAKEINEAYATLRDPTSRHDYDLLNGRRASASTSQSGEPKDQEHPPKPDPPLQKQPDPAVRTIMVAVAVAVAIIVTIGILQPNKSTSYTSPVTASTSGPLRRFCIGNETLSAVTVSINWGGEDFQPVDLRPGYEVQFESSEVQNPVATFVATLAESVELDVAVTDQPASCPTYFNFQYKDMPDRYYGRQPSDRFGLFKI